MFFHINRPIREQAGTRQFEHLIYGIGPAEHPYRRGTLIVMEAREHTMNSI